MDYYLVDVENVYLRNPQKIKGVKEGDQFVFFYTEECKNKLLKEALDNAVKANLELSCYHVQTGTKNALDFQLSAYLGYLIREAGSVVKYNIVSNDKGYDCLCTFWKDRNILVNRIGVTDEDSILEKVKKLLSKEKLKTELLECFMRSSNLSDLHNDIANLIVKSGEEKTQAEKQAIELYKQLKPLAKKYYKTKNK